MLTAVGLYAITTVGRIFELKEALNLTAQCMLSSTNVIGLALLKMKTAESGLCVDTLQVTICVTALFKREGALLQFRNVL